MEVEGVEVAAAAQVEVGKRGWEGRASADWADEAKSSKKRRADNWQDTEVDGLVAAYRQIHVKLAVAGKRGKTVFGSAYEKWNETQQLLNRMGIERQAKEIERKWSNLYTGFKQILEWNKRLGNRSYWEVDEQTTKEKTKAKELPSTFRMELFDAMIEFLGDDSDPKLRPRDSPSSALPASPLYGGVDVPLPMDKLASHVPPFGTQERRPQLVLVATGNFNPPTYLHLRLFEIARDWLTCEGFDVLGGYMSPFHDAHNKKGLAPAEHRIKLCQLATSDSQFVMVDPWEAKQLMSQKIVQVLSRIDTAINGKIPGEERVKVMLLCGSDVLQWLSTPGAWVPQQTESICEDFGIICVTRDGSNTRKLIFDNDFLYEHRRNILLVDEWIQNDISSTKIRHMVAQGLSVKYLTPDVVVKYIKLNHLYGHA
ncbi:unnamed protein product [Sphagnum balticum]